MGYNYTLERSFIEFRNTGDVDDFITKINQIPNFELLFRPLESRNIKRGDNWELIIGEAGNGQKNT
jgi:hypothetical protein